MCTCVCILKMIIYVTSPALSLAIPYIDYVISSFRSYIHRPLRDVTYTLFVTTSCLYICHDRFRSSSPRHSFPAAEPLPRALRNAVFHDGPRPLPGFDTSTFTCYLSYSYRTYLHGDTRNYVSIPCLDRSYSHLTHLHGGTTPSYVMLKNES
jgi:hypothetical protein